MSTTQAMCSVSTVASPLSARNRMPTGLSSASASYSTTICLSSRSARSDQILYDRLPADVRSSHDRLREASLREPTNGNRTGDAEFCVRAGNATQSSTSTRCCSTSRNTWTDAYLVAQRTCIAGIDTRRSLIIASTGCQHSNTVSPSGATPLSNCSLGCTRFR